MVKKFEVLTLTILSHHQARDIHIIKELEDVDTMERQAVNFLCEVNQLDVDGRWYRDDCRIRPGDNIKIRHNGRRRKRYIKSNKLLLYLKRSCVATVFLLHLM